MGRVLSFGWLLPVAVAGVVIELVRLRRSRRTVGPFSAIPSPRPRPRPYGAIVAVCGDVQSVAHSDVAMPRYRLPVMQCWRIFAAVALLGKEMV